MIIARFERLLAAAAALAATAAWVVFFRADLVLSHYDAKAHLVVSRRVFDNLTPGWQQIGAVWLPLPHLLQMIPAQIDLLYQTGASGSALSIGCFAVTAWAFARVILRATGSQLGAAVSTALLALNPNLLYLHATPMTEPLLLALSALVVLWVSEWVESDAPAVPVKLAAVLFATTWTRYEGWFVVAAAGTLAALALWRRGVPLPDVARRTLRLAAWPMVAAALFLANSRITVGSWFVSSGFFVPDPLYDGQPLRVLVGIWWGTHELSGYVTEIAALAAALTVVVSAFRRKDAALVALALFAAALLPFAAFVDGHPYRIRYMVPLVAACALWAGLATAFSRRLAPAVAAVLIAAALVESPPWDREAPMLVEAQWDVPNSRARRAVSACLADAYRGDKVMASMGSLAHYMQELSWRGFAIADFIHEGNGIIWETAMETGPAMHAGWMLVEEQAEGGDVLAQRIRRDPDFVAGMERLCDGGGVALYRRRTG
ncbi:MAG: hypothetical protein AB7K63_06930 [Vicinamibacterales bacterium]